MKTIRAMRLRRRYLLPVAVVGVTAVVLPTIASSVPLSVEAVNEPPYYHHWSNAQQTIMAGQEVAFRNPYSTTNHGLKFTGGTAGTTPSCAGIPSAAGEPNGAPSWEGKCTFSKPGTYTFVCTVHAEMKGTITVTNGEPTAITEAATSVSETEATLKGSVNPEGKATKYFFKWGTTESYGHETNPQPAGEGTTAVPATEALKGLAPGTTYHFRLFAENEKGPAKGADETFTTTSPPPPPGSPAATTSEATSVGETEATLKGTVNPDGRPTKYLFEWGTSNAYGQVTAEASAGEDHTGHTASSTLTGLSPGTVYHFRLVAKNTSSEIVQGDDHMFKTASPSSPAPSSPTPPPSSPPTMTTTPTATIATTPMAPIEPLPGSPLIGGSKALELTGSQHGSSVRGSIDVSQAGAGGELEVVLLATGASLARTHRPSAVRAGRIRRSSVKAGVVSFAVPLAVRAKRALHRHHRLALTVRIVLTPVSGAAVTVTKSVVLHG